MKMKVIVTGAGGQLGCDIVNLFDVEERFEVYGLSRTQLDVNDESQVIQRVREIKPHAIIHAAAYTAVDAAESDEETAFQVNVAGTRNLAMAAEEVGAKFCYISTDYVFNGKASIPYHTDAPTNPINIYGRTKLDGEKQARLLSTRCFVVRTSWVYGIHGHNFVKTMLKLATQQDRLKVVNDQTGSPTYTVDLANFLAELIVTDKYGIYHATNAGICTWFEFAQAIFAESGLSIEVEPCATEDFPRPAPRPRYSVLDPSAIVENGFQPLRPWRDGLIDFLTQYTK